MTLADASTLATVLPFIFNCPFTPNPFAFVTSAVNFPSLCVKDTWVAPFLVNSPFALIVFVPTFASNFALYLFSYPFVAVIPILWTFTSYPGANLPTWEAIFDLTTDFAHALGFNDEIFLAKEFL